MSDQIKLSRRAFMRSAGVAMAGLAAACTPIKPSAVPATTIPRATATPFLAATEAPTNTFAAATSIPLPTARPPIARQPYLEGMIQTAEDGHGFIETGTLTPFVPVGCNYFDPLTGWAPKIWGKYDHERVARHFGLIADAGFTTIRVFLDMSTLNLFPDYYSEKGWAKVDDLLATAEMAGLRVILSGPNSWEGTPRHLAGDRFTNPQIMEYINELWRKLAERYGNSPVVMAWDLLNEPAITWPTYSADVLPAWRAFANETLQISVDDRLPTYTVENQERSLWCTYLHFQEQLAINWVYSQVQALRSAGARQMISVGLIQWSIPIFLPNGVAYSCFNPGLIAPYLDYTSVHFYPMLSQPDLDQEFDLQRAYLQVVTRGAYVSGKPLVLEEFGWKGGKLVPGESVAWPQEQQARWGNALLDATQDVCSGWLNWAFADAAAPNADLSAASGLWTENEELKRWGSEFSNAARNLRANPPGYAPAQVTWVLEKCDYLYQNNGHPPLSWLKSQLESNPSRSVEVIFNN